MTSGKEILIVGGFGAVGRRMVPLLEAAFPGSVVAAGRNPLATEGLRARRIDVDDPAAIEAALDGIGTIVACVRQREPHLLHAAVRRGLAYTSIAPPSMEGSALAPLQAEAGRTGARIVLATGLEPGISSVLARIGADRLGSVDGVETALLLGVGDTFGPDSMGFILEELAQSYSMLVDGHPRPARAFGQSVMVDFRAPLGRRRAYTMPFSDQLYYPTTLGARTSIARLALDPPGVGRLLAGLVRIGASSWSARPGGHRAMERVSARIRRRYADRDRFALVVEVRAGDRTVRSSLSGRTQAHATAVGASATVEALHSGAIDRPGVWLAEQVLATGPFLGRLAAAGLVPFTEELRDGVARHAA
jgi:saccharopine dehydrogenase-like NADP-dependent oxidoreductase